MIKEEKQSELQRHRAILLATLDYLEERLGGSFVYDQHDPVTEYYQQQKIQTEKYFKQRKLDRLQQQLASLTKGLQNRADLTFSAYIKEKTGYNIDIFEDFRKRFDAIVAQNDIRSQNELNEIGTILNFYQRTYADGEEVDRLKVLLNKYSESSHTASKRKREYSKVVSRVEKDGIEEVTVRISTYPKPKHFEEQETVSVSPDGKRRLRVTQWSDRKHDSTYVTVEFPTANGAVYATSGICADIKAWWKDNSSIVIETKKEYTVNTQHKQVRSFDDVIS
ncbi:MAG: hypothetical protein EOP45_08700, partial [Sphingobacteriaceae bacterium]